MSWKRIEAAWEAIQRRLNLPWGLRTDADLVAVTGRRSVPRRLLRQRSRRAAARLEMPIPALERDLGRSK